mmetsp:Transcript_33448/g.64218  ORF Transcript_33448/g.64218 Transcript_33448/m.64218 type:complete len:98 (+) Transcript_33448:1073-1366(+)
MDGWQYRKQYKKSQEVLVGCTISMGKEKNKQKVVVDHKKILFISYGTFHISHVLFFFETDHAKVEFWAPPSVVLLYRSNDSSITPIILSFSSNLAHP